MYIILRCDGLEILCQYACSCCKCTLKEYLDAKTILDVLVLMYDFQLLILVHQSVTFSLLWCKTFLIFLNTNKGLVALLFKEICLDQLPIPDSSHFLQINFFLSVPYLYLQEQIMNKIEDRLSKCFCYCIVIYCSVHDIILN